MIHMRSGLLAGMILLLVFGNASVRGWAIRGEEKPLFARLIGPQTAFFFHLPYDALADSATAKVFSQKTGKDLDQLGKNIEEGLGIRLDELNRFTFYIDNPGGWVGNDQPIEPVPLFLIESKNALNKDLILQKFKNGKKTNLGKYELWTHAGDGVAFLNDKTMLRLGVPARGRIDPLSELLPIFVRIDTPDIPEAMQPALKLAQGNQQQAVFGFQLPDDLRKFAYRALNGPESPATLKMFKPLLELKHGVGTIDFGSGAEGQIAVKTDTYYTDEAKARAALGTFKFSISATKMMLSNLPAKQAEDMQKVVAITNKVLEDVQLSQDKDTVKISYRCNFDYLTMLLLPAIKKVRNAADRMVSASNMRQLMIAMHNFHVDYAELPRAAHSDKNGKPLLSWRVTVLPYLEQDELFKKFKVDEPWDSPHNKAVLENNPMPKIFEHPAKKDGNNKVTYYKVFVSKNGVNPAAGFTEGRKITLGQLTVQDGTSNTIAMVESGPPVIWTKPEDIEFDPNKPFPKLISVWDEPFTNTCFFDGSVRQAKIGVHEDVWKGFVTRNGGENVDFSKIEKE